MWLTGSGPVVRWRDGHVRSRSTCSRSGRAVWLACIAAAPLGENEVNWAAPGYLSTGLTGTYLDRRLFPAEGSNALGSIRRRWIYGATWGLSMASLFIFMHLAGFLAVLVRLAPAWLLRVARRRCALIDPTTRMRGFTPLGPILKERLESLRAGAGDPFVLTPTYSLTASASFVLAGVENPAEEAYCLSWTPGMAAAVANQHDLWHPNPCVDAASFAGRPVIVVEDGNASTPSYARGLVDLGIFERAEPTERIVIRDRGTVVAAWDLTVCRGYRGPRNVDAMRCLFAVYSTRRYYNAHGGTPRDSSTVFTTTSWAAPRALTRNVTGPACSTASAPPRWSRGWPRVLNIAMRTL